MASTALGLFGGMAVYDALGETGPLVVAYTKSQLLGQQPPFGGKSRASILVLGLDKRTNDSGRFDTIMVGSVDVATKEIRVLSIPRDTRVEIPGTLSYDKINATMPRGGVDVAVETVEQMLNVPIDYYAVTDIDGFGRVVDRLGGVEIDVERDMHYVDRRGGLYIDLSKGVQRLDGDKALQYVRFRHEAEGDIARIRRQQKFMRAVVHEMGRLSKMLTAPRAIGELRESIDTDLAAEDIVWLIRTLKNTSDDKIRCFTVPGSNATIGGGSYRITDENKLEPIIEYVFYGGDEAALEPPSIEIYNASGDRGLARRAAQRLRERGYTVSTCRTWPDGELSRSRVVDNRGCPQAARALADLLDLRTVSTQGDETRKADITVILGTDYTERKG
jgi:LCP family protein required for cell wall assembly